MQNGRRHLWAGLLLTGVVLGCYWNSVGNGFVLDDHTNIVENPALSDARAIPRLATTAYFDLAGPVTFYYRPLATLSFFADYALWGANPVGFHLTNLLLHIGTSLLVYAFFTRLMGAWEPAVVGAALFAAHPAFAETANYISGGRNVLLSAALFLLALVSLLQWTRGRPWRLVAGLGAYALALLARESAAVLLLLLPLLDWTLGRPGPGPGPGPGNDRRRMPVYLGLGLITVGYGILRFGVMSPPYGASPAPLAERLLVWPYATWLHLRLLVMPLNLSAQYVFDSPQSVTDPWVVFPAAVLVSLFLGLFWLWYRGQRLACVGLVWIFIALGPVSNVIPYVDIGVQPVAERYLYLPGIGWALLLALALGRPKSRALRLGVAGFLLVACATLTVHRTPVWRNDLILWTDTVEKMPGSPWAHVNVGLWHEKGGNLSQALREYAWAAELFVQDRRLLLYAVTAYHRAGSTAFFQGRLELAAHYVRQASMARRAVAR